MSEWKSFCLGDVCITNAKSYSKNDNWTFVNYLDTGNIAANKIEDIQYINILEEKLPSRARRKVKTDSIIYSTVRPNQRHYGIIKSQPKNFLVSTGFAVIDVNSEIVDANFLYYRLTQDEVVQYLQSVAEQSTTAYPSIRPVDIENLKFSFPPLETQKKIAAMLSALDDKIELNNAISKNLEEQSQAIFKNMFVDNFNPAWRRGTLGEFVEIKRGGSPRPIQDYLSDDGLRWLKISDVTSLESPYVMKIKEHIKESGIDKTVFLNSGSLVLSNSATPGIPKILDVDTCIHDGWLYFPESKFSKYFLYLYFKHIKKQLINLGNGSVFTNLKIEIVKSFPVILPGEKTLRRFDELIVPLFESMKNITHENKKLGEIRDALLPRLMSGEIDVSAVEI